MRKPTPSTTTGVDIQADLVRTTPLQNASGPAVPPARERTPPGALLPVRLERSAATAIPALGCMRRIGSHTNGDSYSQGVTVFTQTLKVAVRVGANGMLGGLDWLRT